MIVKIGNNEFETQNVEQLLQIDIVSTRIFENDVNKIRKKTSLKLISRIPPYMAAKKRRK